MRTRVAVSFLLSIAACANQRPIESVPFADAAYHRDEASFAAPPIPTDDAVTAELMRGAFACCEQRRRVALENLANVLTCAYKRRIVRTSTHDVVGADGVVFQVPFVESVVPTWTPGVLEATNRALDLAIDGEGFFAVHLLDGSIGYTRAGALQINADGNVVTGFGSPILPEITVPGDFLDIAISPDGVFQVRTAGNPESMTGLGSLRLHRFVNPAGLRCTGDVWRPTEESGCPITAEPGQTGVGWVKQGFLERSNVQHHEELEELRTLERQHDALLTAMQHLGTKSK